MILSLDASGLQTLVGVTLSESMPFVSPRSRMPTISSSNDGLKSQHPSENVATSWAVLVVTAGRTGCFNSAYNENTASPEKVPRSILACLGCPGPTHHSLRRAIQAAARMTKTVVVD
jgi:hypothetical protein